MSKLTETEDLDLRVVPIELREGSDCSVEILLGPVEDGDFDIP